MNTSKATEYIYVSEPFIGFVQGKETNSPPPLGHSEHSQTMERLSSVLPSYATLIWVGVVEASAGSKSAPFVLSRTEYQGSAGGM